MCATACVQRPEDKFVESILCFHDYRGSRYHIKPKHLALQSHLTPPPALLHFFICSLSIYLASVRQWDKDRSSFSTVPTSIHRYSVSCLPEHSGTRFYGSVELADTSKTYTKQNKYSTEERKWQYLHLPLYPSHIQYSSPGASEQLDSPRLQVFRRIWGFNW